ncbi:MAG: Flp pilus assembly protein CpaB [Rhodospirillales bacterium]|nr:Flp pilus assembly protein CpaB [Rhodospirillales bacterium]
MNFRTIILVVVAIATAGFTAFYAKNWLAAQRAALEADAPPAAVSEAAAATVEVLVAGQDLPTGTFLKSDNLKWQPWPEDSVSDSYITRAEFVEADFEGAVTRNQLFANEPVTPARVVHPGEQGFLAAVLDPGLRAVSVPVDATTGIAGFVFPGDIVDVILTFRVGVKEEENNGGQTRFFSETLLRKVRVLAIDQQVDNEDGMAKVAKTTTLEVSSKQAEKIALALEIGSLSLSLRSLTPEPAVGVGVTTIGTDAEGDGEDLRSYTRDFDIYYMIGDPLGLPVPGAKSKVVDVLHGKTAEQVSF